MDPLERTLVLAIGVCLLVIAVCNVWILVDRIRARRRLRNILQANTPRAGSGR